MTRWKTLLISLLIALWTSSALAAEARQETGFLNRTLSLGGHTYRYSVYLPSDYTSDRTWPVILFLHGSGERGSEGLRPESIGLGPAIRWWPPRFPGLAVFLQCPEDSTWMGEPAQAALAALDATVEEFGADPDREYLTGLSMGGYGTWYLAYEHPERFAAIVPVCSGIVPPEDDEHDVLQIPETLGAADPYLATARRVRALPCWIFHGAKDDVLPVEDARRMYAALKQLGTDVHYTEFAELGHGCWDPAYGGDELWSWLLAQRRKH
jgi:predicted peptidase